LLPEEPLPWHYFDAVVNPDDPSHSPGEFGGELFLIVAVDLATERNLVATHLNIDAAQRCNMAAIEKQPNPNAQVIGGASTVERH
jgi:hypothetical protein